jgi:hypothetical protein
MFVPLALLITTNFDSVSNPLQSATLEIGVLGFQPFYQATGMVRETNSDEETLLSLQASSLWNQIDGGGVQTEWIVSFPIHSSSLSVLPAPSSKDLLERLVNDTSSLTPYFRYRMRFRWPVTDTGTCDVEYWDHGTIDEPMSRLLSETFSRTQVSVPWNIVVPRIIIASGSATLEGKSEYSFDLQLSNEVSNAWKLERGSVFLDEKENEFKLLVSSKGVRKEGIGQRTGDSAFVAFYILLIVLAGLSIRERLRSKLEELWIGRMDIPQKLYMMVMSIHLCRNAGEIEREAELAERLLDLLRSHESVLELTSK